MPKKGKEGHLLPEPLNLATLLSLSHLLLMSPHSEFRAYQYLQYIRIFVTDFLEQISSNEFKRQEPFLLLDHHSPKSVFRFYDFTMKIESPRL